MAKKMIEETTCDYCGERALPDKCIHCKKDVCYGHAACYRPHSHSEGRPDEILLCDACVKELKLFAPKVDRRGILADLRAKVGME